MALSLILLSPWALYYRFKLKHSPGDPIDPGVEKIVKKWAECMLACAGVKVLAEGSELEVNENQHQYGVKAIHEAGYGFWQDACLVTFT